MMPLLLVALTTIGWSSGAVYAKNLAYAEYFIDTDPGQGNGTPINPCDGIFDSTTESFCVSNIASPALSEGVHTFYLRLRDSDNQWGMRQITFYYTSSSPYAAKTLKRAEYFIDSDPGVGAGTAINAADGILDEAVELLIKDNIDPSALSEGEHTLSVRVMDSYDVWGAARQTKFVVAASDSAKKIVGAEYYVDSDPGSGKGIALKATDGTFDQATESAFLDSIKTTTMSVGEHTVYVRYRDNYSYWSSTFNGWGPSASALLEIRSCCQGTTGNADGSPDDAVDISDIFAVISFLVNSTPMSSCFEENDVNRDGTIDIADIFSLKDYLVDSVPLPSCQ